MGAGDQLPDINLLPALAELLRGDGDALLGGTLPRAWVTPRCCCEGSRASCPSRSSTTRLISWPLCCTRGCAQAYRERVPGRRGADAAWKRVTHWGYSARRAGRYDGRAAARWPSPAPSGGAPSNPARCATSVSASVRWADLRCSGPSWP